MCEHHEFVFNDDPFDNTTFIGGSVAGLVLVGTVFPCSIIAGYVSFLYYLAHKFINTSRFLHSFITSKLFEL